MQLPKRFLPMLAAMLTLIISTGCAISHVPVTLGFGGATITTDFVFKGTDNDILGIAQSNAVLLSKNGKLNLPKSITDRAVLFGNNYPGTDAELHQCVNDAYKNAVNLVRIDHFNPQCIALFTNENCTKANIELAATWAIGEGSTGRRVLMNSSHGAQDTNAEGKIVNIMVTDDMVRKGVWDNTTEVSPEFWYVLVRKAKAPWIVLNDSCHSGGQMKAATTTVNGTPRYPAVRALQGPPAVQARLAKAVGTRGVDNSKITTGTEFNACLASQLANETAQGGAATVAYWQARATLGTNMSVKEIVRESNRLMKESGNTQNMNPVGNIGLLWVK